MANLNFGEENWGNPDRRPSFNQIMWFENLIEMQIPTEFFNDHLESEEAGVVTLRGPCGSWDVTMERRDDGVYLVRGWQDFVEKHSLGKAELAVFMYNGGMSFDVSIYGSNCWLKNYEAAAPQEHVPPPFASSFPFFSHKMKAHNVGPKCTMLIPKAFAREHMSMIKQEMILSSKKKLEMILRDSEGISWAVTATNTNTDHLSLCGGWKAFTDARSIKKGDVCIFELVEKRLMQVHIAR